MTPKCKRSTARCSRTAKRQWRMTYGQVGGVSTGLIIGIGKAGYGITRALGMIKANKPRKSVFDACEQLNKANAKNMQANHLIVLSCNL